MKYELICTNYNPFSLVKDNETESELVLGANLATDLVLHLIRMGAASCIIPINYEGENYEVEVRIK